MFSYGKGAYGFLTGCQGQALRVFKKIFYVVIQTERVLFFISTKDIPLSQDIEEESGSAGEQPAGNKYPALHCNNIREDGIYFPSSLLDSYRHRSWLRKPIRFIYIRFRL